jgi:hypothetical protein
MKNPMGEKIPWEKKSYRIIFPIGIKNPTSIFDLGIFPPFGPFGRNFPTHCLGETHLKQ